MIYKTLFYIEEKMSKKLKNKPIKFNLKKHLLNKEHKIENKNNKLN